MPLPTVPVLGWLASVSFLAVAGNLICGEDLTSATGTNPVSFLVDLVGLGQCDGVPAWVSWILTIYVVVPALLILFSLISPLLNNTVTGTIVGVAALTAGILVAVGFLF